MITFQLLRHIITVTCIIAILFSCKKDDREDSTPKGFWIEGTHSSKMGKKINLLKYKGGISNCFWGRDTNEIFVGMTTELLLQINLNTQTIKEIGIGYLGNKINHHEFLVRRRISTSKYIPYTYNMNSQQFQPVFSVPTEEPGSLTMSENSISFYTYEATVFNNNCINKWDYWCTGGLNSSGYYVFHYPTRTLTRIPFPLIFSEDGNKSLVMNTINPALTQYFIVDNSTGNRTDSVTVTHYYPWPVQEEQPDQQTFYYGDEIKVAQLIPNGTVANKNLKIYSPFSLSAPKYINTGFEYIFRCPFSSDGTKVFYYGTTPDKRFIIGAYNLVNDQQKTILETTIDGDPTVTMKIVVSEDSKKILAYKTELYVVNTGF